MVRSTGIFLFSMAIISCKSETRLNYAPSPPDNPLMGLVPYVDSDSVDRFPHSLEFAYFSLSDLMKGPAEFDWAPVEDKLATASSRGCQLVTRVFLEYPGKGGIPQFLVDGGLKVTEWKSDDGVNRTPDYEDKNLRKALQTFIAAFGAKYDKDPRLAYLTAGILGLWGEWHNYPRSELFASRTVQSEVMSALTDAFTTTPILHRYPAGDNHYAYVKNSDLPMGYHDDSFAWATLDTGKPEDNWYFIPLLKAANALDKWKTHPIGGEIRPELWPTIFTGKTIPGQQDFSECICQTHVTWLMDTSMFEQRFPLPPERKATAIAEVSKMGYSFHIPKWQRSGNTISITVENRGVAPFYRDWPVVLAGFNENKEIWRTNIQGKLTGILPGQSQLWETRISSVSEIELRIAVPNPMNGGIPIRFANDTQGPVWLILGMCK